MSRRRLRAHSAARGGSPALHRGPLPGAERGRGARYARPVRSGRWRPAATRFRPHHSLHALDVLPGPDGCSIQLAKGGSSATSIPSSTPKTPLASSPTRPCCGAWSATGHHRAPAHLDPGARSGLLSEVTRRLAAAPSGGGAARVRTCACFINFFPAAIRDPEASLTRRCQAIEECRCRAIGWCSRSPRRIATPAARQLPGASAGLERDRTGSASLDDPRGRSPEAGTYAVHSSPAVSAVFDDRGCHRRSGAVSPSDPPR